MITVLELLGAEFAPVVSTATILVELTLGLPVSKLVTIEIACDAELACTGLLEDKVVVLVVVMVLEALDDKIVVLVVAVLDGVVVEVVVVELLVANDVVVLIVVLVDSNGVLVVDVRLEEVEVVGLLDVRATTEVIVGVGHIEVTAGQAEQVLLAGTQGKDHAVTSQPVRLGRVHSPTA